MTMRQLDYLGPTRLGQSVERLAELAIAVVEDKSGQAIMLNREIAQLLNHPLGVRALSHADQQGASPAQLQREQNVEGSQSRRGDSEEVRGPDKVFVLPPGTETRLGNVCCSVTGRAHDAGEGARSYCDSLSGPA